METFTILKLLRKFLSNYKIVKSFLFSVLMYAALTFLFASVKITKETPNITPSEFHERVLEILTNLGPLIIIGAIIIGAIIIGVATNLITSIIHTKSITLGDPIETLEKEIEKKIKETLIIAIHDRTIDEYENVIKKTIKIDQETSTDISNKRIYYCTIIAAIMTLISLDFISYDHLSFSILSLLLCWNVFDFILIQVRRKKGFFGNCKVEVEEISQYLIKNINNTNSTPSNGHTYSINDSVIEEKRRAPNLEEGVVQ